MKKFIGGIAVGIIASNLLQMYTDGFFTRFNYLLKGGDDVDTTNTTEVVKYLFDGLQVDDDTTVHMVMKMTGSGYRDIEIADHLGIREITVRMARRTTSLSETRQRMSYETMKEHQEQLATADRLKAEGYSNREIAEQMGIPENAVRQMVDGNTA